MDGLQAADAIQNHCSTSLFFLQALTLNLFSHIECQGRTEKNQYSEEFGVTRGNVSCLSKREREQSSMFFPQYPMSS